jgi:hypothetical protein
VGRHAGKRPQPLEQQAGAETALDSQQVGGVQRDRALVSLHFIYVYFW